MSAEEYAQMTRTLVDVAMGRTCADMVIRDGRWVCVQSGEILPDSHIAIKDGRIAYVGPDASHTIGEETEIIDAAGRYLVPGLLDGHMHVESGMLTVTEFVRAVIPHGTTGIMFHGEVTGITDSFWPFFSRPAVSDIINELRNIYFHRTDINTSLAHGA